jgi:hypothetical protein
MEIVILAFMLCVIGAAVSLEKFSKTKSTFNFVVFSLNLVCIGFLIGVFCMKG